MLHSGWKENDTWIYRPDDNAWKKLDVGSKVPPPSGTGTYLAYDSTRDVLAHFNAGRFWFLRYRDESSALRKAKGPAPREVTLRWTSPSLL